MKNNDHIWDYELSHKNEQNCQEASQESSLFSSCVQLRTTLLCNVGIRSLKSPAPKISRSLLLEPAKPGVILLKQAT